LLRGSECGSGDVGRPAAINATNPVDRMRLAARRAIAGLAVLCVSRERNNADVRIPAGPKGARQTGQRGVAVLDKGAPFPADCALPWSVWRTLHPKLSPGWSTCCVNMIITWLVTCSVWWCLSTN